MKILVIGVGGIGGFIGSYLVNNNYDVTFVQYRSTTCTKCDEQLPALHHVWDRVQLSLDHNDKTDSGLKR